MGLEVTTKPTKTSYLAGDTFDNTGMVVTASYGTGQTIIATADVNGYSVSPNPLTDGVTSVTITYSEGGQTCSTTLPVTVTHRLSAISITTKPTKTTYEYGDTLATAGMVVTASYSDSKAAAVTTYSCSPTTLLTVGNQVVTVSYTENGVTQTATFNVTVNRKSVTKPTWKSNLTYTGSAQSVSSTSYWNNYNTSYMTIGGTTSATTAGTYIATFTPGDNYRWADGTTTAINVNWTINKATGSLSVSPTTVAIDGSNYSSGVAVTITRAGDGAISYSPTSISGLTLSLSGNTLTIKGNGSTAVSATTITISVAEGTNYTAPSNEAVTVSAEYWTWGDETATGDAAWWAGLKNWAANASTSERTACVGKKKLVSLSTAVLGANAATMICIGADQDGTGTLTFQTAGTLPTTTAFGSNNAKWIGSTARTQCQNFYNYCSAKDAIKTVSKGTCPSYNDSRNASVTYNDETVWLLSEREMGLNNYSPISTANSTTTKAECTYGYNESYSYYTSNTLRIKYKMNADGTLTTSTQWYWERSRYYSSGGTNYVCAVSSDGSAGGNGYGGSGGLAPAFVIG